MIISRTKNFGPIGTRVISLMFRRIKLYTVKFFMLLRWLQDRIGSWNLGLHSTHVVLDFSEILGPSLMDMPYSSILSLSLQSLIRQFRSTRLSNNQRCYLLKKEIPVVWTLRFIYTWLVFPAFLHQDSLLQLFYGTVGVKSLLILYIYRKNVPFQ